MKKSFLLDYYTIAMSRRGRKEKKSESTVLDSP